ncbi:MAG: PEP/pyruvate-binding domain-containing protein, partial [Candidatus Saccharimonadales bacterium]
MLQGGLPVPEGLIIPLKAFDKEGKLLADSREELISRLKSEKLYAVRSSALSEDSEDASWAGQFETFLNTKHQDIVNKVEECHNSAKSRAKAYAKAKNTEEFNIAVVVQEMLKPEYAGVLFTKDPLTGEDRMVTEYVEGLGEELVSGRADPERLSWKSGEVADAPFNVEELEHLAKQAIKIFNTPQDIEWAWANNKMWFVQARPITTLGEPTPKLSIEDGLIEMVKLLEAWGMKPNNWILSGQYVYKIMGYDISVRQGHHNILVDETMIPWKISKDALEIYPMADTQYSKDYQAFIKNTGYEFDMIPLSKQRFADELTRTKKKSLPNGEKIQIHTILGQLDTLKDILSKSDEKGWGYEKGQRILILVEELQTEFDRAEKRDLALEHKKVAEQYKNLKKRGFSYDIGLPEDLFYWGPTRAEPLYMSDFMVAAEEFWKQASEKPDLPDPADTLVLFCKSKIVWLNNAQRFSDFTERLFTAYENQNRFEKDFRSWKAAVKELDKIKGDAIDLVKAWKFTIFAEFSLYGAETVLVKRLKRFDPNTRQEIWGAFTVPDTATFLGRIDAELFESHDPKSIAKKYPWIEDGYAGVSNNAEKYFVGRLKVLKENPLNVSNHKKDRIKMAKDLGLTSEEISALDLARQLAEFMDERKAWMMRTRRNIKSSANDLTDGWIFDNGKVTLIDKEETEELWDRYVDFKVSTSAVTGIVASNGGKHFTNGTVKVVNSPTDNVPDGHIVIVPSTSP